MNHTGISNSFILVTVMKKKHHLETVLLEKERHKTVLAAKWLPQLEVRNLETFSEYTTISRIKKMLIMEKKRTVFYAVSEANDTI